MGTFLSLHPRQINPNQRASGEKGLSPFAVPIFCAGKPQATLRDSPEVTGEVGESATAHAPLGTQLS